MPTIKVDVFRDPEKSPRVIEISKKGKTLKITHVEGEGLTFEGPSSVLPSTSEILNVVNLIDDPGPELSLDEPLEVVNVVGGKTILYDDFEDLLKWVQDAATVALDNTVAFGGDQSLKLTCAAGSTHARADIYFPVPLSGLVSFECVFKGADYTKINEVTFQFVIDNGKFTEDCNIKYVAGSLLWQYSDSASTSQDISNSTILAQYDTNQWVKVKWIIDVIHQRYVSLQVNEKLFDLSNFKFRKAGTAGTTYTMFRVLNNNVAGQESIIYYDDVIIKEIQRT